MGCCTKSPPGSRILVALDLPKFDPALALADLIGPDVAGFKLGNELAEAEGLGPYGCVYALNGKKGRTFRDAKLMDIPRTVEAAATALVQPGVEMYNMMALGGLKMLAAGKAASDKRATELGILAPKALAVTILTSLGFDDLVEMGLLQERSWPADWSAEQIVAEKMKPVQDLVVKLALMAQKAGCDGVVCSAQEARIVREACGKGFLIVAPGIRSKTAPPDDQRRVMTIGEAMAAGVDYPVIGRPIVKAEDPKEAVRLLNLEATEALAA